jgi:hypothetical protein
MRYMERTEADFAIARGDGDRSRLIVNTADELVSAYRIVKNVHRLAHRVRR